MRKLAIVLAIPILVGAAYLLAWAVPIEPVAWQPSEHPGMTGVFAANEKLAAAARLVDGIGEGPEDITRGPDGYFYTGLQDGRIVRFRADGGAEDGEVETFATTGGRPLGMQFDAKGNLVVADAFKGLLLVAPDGTVTVLTDSVGGERMIFVDDLDIASDGTVWFSDASQRFDQLNYMLDFFEASSTGRLMSYDPASGETIVHLENLMFANGVALGPGETYVLVNETWASRITRLWLTGPRAGQQDVFVEGLPAYPDNLSYNAAGIFWVALPAPRTTAADRLSPRPLLRKVLMRLPQSLRDPVVPAPIGWVLGVDTEGHVVYSLQDPTGNYVTVTSVNSSTASSTWVVSRCVPSDASTCRSRDVAGPLSRQGEKFRRLAEIHAPHGNRDQPRRDVAQLQSSKSPAAPCPPPMHMVTTP